MFGVRNSDTGFQHGTLELLNQTQLIMQDENKYPFRYARTVEGKDRTYIVFHAFNRDTGKLERRRHAFDLNRYKNVNQRKKRAQALVHRINRLLEDGYCLGTPPQKPEHADIKRTDEAFGYIFEVKTKNARKSTRDNYSALKNVFIPFIDELKGKGNLLSNITKSDILAFLDYGIKYRAHTNCTYNNYLRDLRTSFNFFIDREMIKDNPTRGLSMLPEETRMHRIYTKIERERIKAYLKKNDPQLLRACMFIYYCFIRPAELRALQIKHLMGDRIFIPETIAKNRKAAYVVIPAQFMEEFNKMGFENYSPDAYIFTRKGKPGPLQCGPNYLNYRYKKCKDALELTREQTLYAWKHTGATEFYKETLDIKALQRQCRHANMNDTDAYLRCLGLDDNKTARLKFPAF